MKYKDAIAMEIDRLNARYNHLVTESLAPVKIKRVSKLLRYKCMADGNFELARAFT